MNKPSAILLAGPTASGKSALALKLAAMIDGVIVNADSMQVYRDLRVITARPTVEEESLAPHRLYGHVDAAENYSTGQWLRDARVAIDEVRSAGQVPIVVGGTGLYFMTLTRGLAAVPPIPPGIRADVRGRLESEGVAPLYVELLERDPVAAHRVMPGDRSRISRALEVVLATGRSITDWHKEGMPPTVEDTQAARVFLDVDRDELTRRIVARFDAMLAAGALTEVERLAARGLNPLLPAMKAHGVPWLIRHLRGEIELEEAADGGKRDTRRYIKRQATWFKNQMPDWRWLGADAILATAREWAKKA